MGLENLLIGRRRDLAITAVPRTKPREAAAVRLPRQAATSMLSFGLYCYSIRMSREGWAVYPVNEPRTVQ
jgi:hypothetical protein